MKCSRNILPKSFSPHSWRVRSFLALCLLILPLSLAVSQQQTPNVLSNSPSKMQSSPPTSLTLDQALSLLDSMQAQLQQESGQLKAQLQTSQGLINTLNQQLSQSKAESQAAETSSQLLEKQLTQAEQDRQSFASTAQSQIQVAQAQRDKAQAAANRNRDIAIGAVIAAVIATVIAVVR